MDTIDTAFFAVSIALVAVSIIMAGITLDQHFERETASITRAKITEANPGTPHPLITIGNSSSEPARLLSIAHNEVASIIGGDGAFIGVVPGHDTWTVEVPDLEQFAETGVLLPATVTAIGPATFTLDSAPYKTAVFNGLASITGNVRLTSVVCGGPNTVNLTVDLATTGGGRAITPHSSAILLNASQFNARQPTIPQVNIFGSLNESTWLLSLTIDLGIDATALIAPDIRIAYQLAAHLTFP